MAKRHYIPVTADVPGAASEGNCALIRKVIRTALAAEGVDVPCEVDVLLTNDSGIHEINREMRQVDASTDVLSFPEFDLRPGELPAPEDADPGTGLVPLGDMVISMEHVAAQAREYGHSKRRELSLSGGALCSAPAGVRPSGRGAPRRPRCGRERKPSWGSWASGGESLPGQAPAGAQAQQESVDGGELQVFFIAFQGVITQLVMNHIHVEVIVVRWDSVQVGLDVVEIKPYHKV